MQIDHPSCYVFRHMQPMHPRQRNSRLFFVKQLKHRSASAQLRDNIEVILLLRHTNQRYEIDLRGDLHKRFDLTLEFLLIPLVQLVYFHFLNRYFHIVQHTLKHFPRVARAYLLPNSQRLKVNDQLIWI